MVELLLREQGVMQENTFPNLKSLSQFNREFNKIYMNIHESDASQFPDTSRLAAGFKP